MVGVHCHFWKCTFIYWKCNPHNYASGKSSHGSSRIFGLLRQSQSHGDSKRLSPVFDMKTENVLLLSSLGSDALALSLWGWDVSVFPRLQSDSRKAGRTTTSEGNKQSETDWIKPPAIQIRITTANVCYIGIWFQVQDELPHVILSPSAQRSDPRPSLMQDGTGTLLSFTKETVVKAWELVMQNKNSKYGVLLI